jgi:hypothetical protein
VTTRRDPDTGMYIMTGPDGNDLEPVTAEQLIKGFQETWTNKAQIDKMMGVGSLGREPGAIRPYQGESQREGGTYGRGRSTGGTFKDRLFPSTYAALEKKHPDMEPHELHLKTLETLSQTGSPSNNATILKTRIKMLEGIAGLRASEQPEALIQMEAQLEALQATMDGYGAGDGGGDGGERRYDDEEEWYESIYNVPTDVD